MNCKHCHRPVALVPSAAERARKCGGEPSDYVKIFDYHAACTLELRRKGTAELMERIRGTAAKT